MMVTSGDKEGIFDKEDAGRSGRLPGMLLCLGSGDAPL